MYDEILKQFGLKYEDLNTVEKETLHMWYKSLSKQEFNINTLKGYISAMKESVEAELEKYDNSKDQDIFLKARLKNYRLLEAFLTSPDKAREALERTIGSLVGKKKEGDLL